MENSNKEVTEVYRLKDLNKDMRVFMQANKHLSMKERQQLLKASYEYKKVKVLSNARSIALLVVGICSMIIFSTTMVIVFPDGIQALSLNFYPYELSISTISWVGRIYFFISLFIAWKAGTVYGIKKQLAFPEFDPATDTSIRLPAENHDHMMV